MRVFEYPNLSNIKWKCPICGTRDKKEVVLVGKSGTEEGRIAEAEQVHLDCIELIIFESEHIIAMKY